MEHGTFTQTIDWLAFTLPEAMELAANLAPSAEVDVEAVWRAADGWPVALHAGFVGPSVYKEQERASGGVTPGRAFTEYIAEEVLGQLEPSLADFVLRATTCDWLEHELAIALSGVQSGGFLLQECIRKGLFIEEKDVHGVELGASPSDGRGRRLRPRVEESPDSTGQGAG